MIRSGGGTFKYVSGWHAPSTLPGNVSASYDGKIKNVQLTIATVAAHIPPEHGAHMVLGECPGWRVDTDRNLPSALFNDTVFPRFYDTSLGATVTLTTLLF